MNETPGLSEQYRKTSPWPLFIALGVPISEIGLVFDIFPVAVGGLLLFCGCIAGMLQVTISSGRPAHSAADTTDSMANIYLIWLLLYR